MDEILVLISLVREWHCDESWMRNRDIARCNRTARQCWYSLTFVLDIKKSLYISIFIML